MEHPGFPPDPPIPTITQETAINPLQNRWNILFLRAVVEKAIAAFLTYFSLLNSISPLILCLLNRLFSLLIQLNSLLSIISAYFVCCHAWFGLFCYENLNFHVDRLRKFLSSIFKRFWLVRYCCGDQCLDLLINDSSWFARGKATLITDVDFQVNITVRESCCWLGLFAYEIFEFSR